MADALKEHVLRPHLWGQRPQHHHHQELVGEADSRASPRPADGELRLHEPSDSSRSRLRTAGSETSTTESASEFQNYVWTQAPKAPALWGYASCSGLNGAPTPSICLHLTPETCEWAVVWKSPLCRCD